MTVRVGVIGTGMIGEDHIRRLCQVLSGSQVTAVTDVDTSRAEAVASRLPGVAVRATGQDVVADDRVDAVMVTSWGPTHAEYVLASLAAGKPVFCEKPLATTQEDCLRIIEAEVSGGRRLVQVGFMRRYDTGYRGLKATVGEGSIGAPTMFHSAHRNPSVPPHYTGDMMITDTAVHDIDVTRWLLDDEVTAAAVLTPRRSSRAPEGLQDPLVLLLETASGVLVDVEIAVTIGYGYDIRGEVVGELGTAALGDAEQVVLRADGARSGRVPATWRERFVRAYDVELQEWLDAVAAGGSTGPSSWDGYAATAVADAGVRALQTGERVPVSLVDRPALYDK
jgi:myo-inositol 2-dehydrogenase / D-chiro-inositol 1-dehydrogenase